MQETKPINVLVSLYRGYGLGDAVQMSAVLRHLKKHYPRWRIDYQAEEGKHCVGRGLVHRTFPYGQEYPQYHYDREFQVCLYDRWMGWMDRPNTHVSSTLREVFDLDWDPECGRYCVEVSDRAMVEARALAGSCLKSRSEERGLVGIHYQGRTAQVNKDLSHEQASIVCKYVRELGMTPLLFDWHNTSPLSGTDEAASTGQVTVLGARGLIQTWGADAEMTCALIQQCRAFIGIDSGPSKCASATDVPTLVVWTKHHPARFHDPAPNTTHLVQKDYEGTLPYPRSDGVMSWFYSNYKVVRYYNDPIPYIETWLTETLR